MSVSDGHDDTFEEVLGEIAESARSAALKAQLLEAFLQSPHHLVKLLRVDVDLASTAGAHKAALCAEASDRALALRRALRTWDGDFLPVEQVLRHLVNSVGGMSAPTVGPPVDSGNAGVGGAANLADLLAAFVFTAAARAPVPA